MSMSLYFVLFLATAARAQLESPDFRLSEDDEKLYKAAKLREYLKMLSQRLDEWADSGFAAVPPPRHRPYKQFTYSVPDNTDSNFAVPPTDDRFYQLQDYINSEDEALSNPQEHSTISEQTVTEFQEEAVSSPQVFKTPLIDFNATKEDIIFVAVVAGSSAAVVVGVALLGYGWYRLHKSSKAAADVEYPAYGVTGPNKDTSPTGDRRLAHSAQMYHYQLTKQQIIAMESNRGSGERRGSVSEVDSDDENEEGDYTVYECPGLAPTGEMEVKNPLFLDDTTPAIGGASGTTETNPVSK